MQWCRKRTHFRYVFLGNICCRDDFCPDSHFPYHQLPGKDRGIDYTDFAVDLENSNLSVIIGTKTTGHKIIDMMVANGTEKTLIKAENLEEAVKSAYENTKKDGVCILSPAASSYNEYKNFEEKGRHYKELVKKYGV